MYDYVCLWDESYALKITLHFTFIMHRLCSLCNSNCDLVIWYILFRSPPEFPKVVLPEDLPATVALLIRDELNYSFKTFREVASGNDLKKFLWVPFYSMMSYLYALALNNQCLFMLSAAFFQVIVALWVISVVGSWFDFLTLLYLGGFQLNISWY